MGWEQDNSGAAQMLQHDALAAHNAEMRARRRCANCVYWDEQTSTGPTPEGFCRCHAPRPRTYRAGHDEEYRAWPLTLADEWCGEFAGSG